MLEMKKLSDPSSAQKLLDEVIHLAMRFRQEKGRIPVFMEVCGSHTMAFAKSGIKTKLQDYVRLIAGPGCPVCVTDQKSIDAIIQLTEQPNRIICTFGDMMRVPGSKTSLLNAKTEGYEIRVIYSPLDTIKIAEQHPNQEVILLGIGFETTIPSLALAIREAKKKQLTNYSIWMTTKLVAPVLRTLLDSGEIKLDGLLLPGHVSIVIGKQSYDFLVKEYGISGVIAGFEPVELLISIYKLLQLLLEEKVEILNEYPYVVKEKGNLVAQELIEHYLDYHDESWRGIGVIPQSGYTIKDAYSAFDARRKYQLQVEPPRKTTCRCGEIIRGLITPEECTLFHKACTPTNPIGPCMVSTEGTCAAHYHYMREE